jgi:(S)-ureidoglycine-glyoxylate aminotransferase
MGYGCRKQTVLICLGALETVLRQQGFGLASGAGVDAALAAYHAAES